MKLIYIMIIIYFLILIKSNQSFLSRFINHQYYHLYFFKFILIIFVR